MICHNLAVSDTLRGYFAVVSLRQGACLDLLSPFIAESVELIDHFQRGRLRGGLKSHDGIIDGEGATLIIFNGDHSRI